MSEHFERPPTTNGQTTFDEFNLRCKVVKFTKSWEEPADDNKIHTADMIALVFDRMPDEAQRFIGAWKPDDEEKNTFEFAMKLGSPINAPARGCYQNPNKYVKEDHIFLMNHAAELMLIDALKYKKNLEILVTVMPEDKDSVADAAMHSGKKVDTRFDF